MCSLWNGLAAEMGSCCLSPVACALSCTVLHSLHCTLPTLPLPAAPPSSPTLQAAACTTATW